MLESVIASITHFRVWAFFIALITGLVGAEGAVLTKLPIKQCESPSPG